MVKNLQVAAFNLQ